MIMIQFSTQGAYLLLIPYSGQGAYFFFESQPKANVQNKTFIWYLLENRNCNKYLINVLTELMFEGIMHSTSFLMQNYVCEQIEEDEPPLICVLTAL